MNVSCEKIEIFKRIEIVDLLIKCTLKNTADFFQNLYKIMRIYNQNPLPSIKTIIVVLKFITVTINLRIFLNKILMKRFWKTVILLIQFE